MNKKYIKDTYFIDGTPVTMLYEVEIIDNPFTSHSWKGIMPEIMNGEYNKIFRVIKRIASNGAYEKYFKDKRYKNLKILSKYHNNQISFLDPHHIFIDAQNIKDARKEFFKQEGYCCIWQTEYDCNGDKI